MMPLFSEMPLDYIPIEFPRASVSSSSGLSAIYVDWAQSSMSSEKKSEVLHSRSVQITGHLGSYLGGFLVPSRNTYKSYPFQNRPS